MQETRAQAGTSSEQESVHASYFFNFYDEEFLIEAYGRLLKREPDPTGRTYYLASLRAGESRYRILSSLAHSNEAKELGVKLNGMWPYRCMKVIKAIPILGSLAQAGLFFWRVDALLKDLRALENHVYRLSTKFDDL